MWMFLDTIAQFYLDFLRHRLATATHKLFLVFRSHLLPIYFEKHKMSADPLQFIKGVTSRVI